MIAAAAVSFTCSISCAQQPQSDEQFWTSPLSSGPADLKDVPETRRTYCGGYVLVIPDVGGIAGEPLVVVYDASISRRIAVFGPWSTCRTPNGLSEAECRAIGKQVAAACLQVRGSAPNSRLEDDAIVSALRASARAPQPER